MYFYAILQKYVFPCHGIIQDAQNKEIIAMAVVEAKSLQSCPILCNPIGDSLPGSSIPGILQVRTPEWVAISFYNAWKWKLKVKLFSHVWLFMTLCTTAYQAPPSMQFVQARVLEWVAIAFSNNFHISV